MKAKEFKGTKGEWKIFDYKAQSMYDFAKKDIDNAKEVIYKALGKQMLNFKTENQ